MTRAKLTIVLIILLASALGVARFSEPASSAPLSSGANQRLTLYEGVFSVTPVSPGDTLELGNAGRDIASTGEIYLRPNSTNAGSRFSGTGDATQSLYLTGRLDVSELCFNPSSCQTTWPTGGGGDPWRVDANALVPNDLNYGVKVENTTGEFPDYGYALNIFGSTAIPTPALFVQNTDANATAATFSKFASSSDMDINGDLKVTGDVYEKTSEGVGYGRVWHTGNTGVGSGLDADYIDGMDVALITDDPGGMCVYDYPCFCVVGPHDSYTPPAFSACIRPFDHQ